jgi:hypothetical protein
MRWKNLRTCFKRELDAQKNVPSGERRRKRRKYLYFDQLLFLLPHVEDRTTHSNLSTPNNENEEDEDTSREEEKEVPQIVCQRKQTKMSSEELLLQTLREKKKEDMDIDEDRCLLLSLLPSFKQFNDEQKFLARMEILKIMQHIKLSQNMHTYSSYSLPSFSDANSVPPHASHFEINPLNPQPVPSMPNSEILSRYFSSYRIDPQRP